MSKVPNENGDEAKGWAVGVGDSMRDEPEPTVNASPEAIRSESLRVEAARDFETHHKCLSCAHARVCAVSIAVQSMGAEGDLVISHCSAFEPDGSDEIESTEETSDESTEEKTP